MLTQSQSSQNYSTWLSEQRETADVVINPMPEGLPYYVDMTQFETEDETVDESTVVSPDDLIVPEGSTDGSAVTAEGSDAELSLIHI